MTLTQTPPEVVAPSTTIGTLSLGRPSGPRIEREHYILQALRGSPATGFEALRERLPFDADVHRLRQDVKRLERAGLIETSHQAPTDKRPERWAKVVGIALTRVGQAETFNVPASVRVVFGQYVTGAPKTIPCPLAPTNDERRKKAKTPDLDGLLAEIDKLRASVVNFTAEAGAENKRLKAENKELRAYQTKVQSLFGNKS